ncbi:MAG: glycosyltransferase family 2 protein [Myxococcales bacterium]|nr:glycosyltransferase family 2 protein [Myxococcales bacterium]
MTEPRTLFIIPAYNESANIERVLQELSEVARPEEILVVSDGSTDNTAALTRRQPVALLEFPFNLGVASVMQAGFRYALRHGFTAAVQFDGDGQHVPGEAAKLLAALAAGDCDIAIGYRSGGERVSTLARHLGSKILAALLVLLTRRFYRDPTSGFRAFSRRAIEAFAKNFPEEYPEVESIVLAKKLGLRIRETPVTMRPRIAGKSSITVLGSAYYMVKVMLASLVIMLRRY